tara:strand:- start:66698 stop:68269 length:1572 start_codon:yes stop_codon:yes gene_type:complete
MTGLASARTLPELLDDRVAVYGNREFLLFEQQSYGFADIRQASAQVGAGLHKMGIGKGDKVALMLNNCPEYLFCWFGLAMLGAIEVPINTAHKGTLLRYLLEQSESTLLLVDRDFLPQLEAVPDDIQSLVKIVVLGEYDTTIPGVELTDYQTLIGTPASLPDVSIQPEDPLAIMFTSGTTGPSKGAVIPQHYPLAMGKIVADSADYNDQDCLYNALPLFHGNAQFLSTVPALMSGARMVLGKRFSAGQFWSDIRDYGCTEFNYIGGIIPILLKAAPDARDADNPLRVMVGAGAPADLSATFEERFGVRLVEAYGMSEIGIPVSNSLTKRKLGSCGYQHPDYDILLLDDEGCEVGPNKPGELLVRPRKLGSMMLEYYRMPEQTIEAWQNLWFHTGDYLQRDEEGFFYFVDRKKDALRRRGENISSYEVEKEINQHPSVLESAAVAVKSELGEDEVMVVVCLKADQTLSPLDLIEHCKTRMAYFMVPRYLRFVDKMPKTPTERIQKFQLRKEGVTADTYDRESSV